MKYYKAVTKDYKSFYDGKTDWQEPLPVLENAAINGPCGIGYHLGKSIKDAISYTKFPFRLIEVEPLSESLGEDATKIRVSHARMIRKVKLPNWAFRAERFLDSIQNVKWLSNCLSPRKSWNLFESRDAALMIQIKIVEDLGIIENKHVLHAKQRWDVWQRGYGLYCDIDGKLYVYKNL